MRSGQRIWNSNPNSSAAMDPKVIRLKVFRFNPGIDERPRFQEYEVVHESSMSVLSALQYIYERLDGTLSLNGYFCYRKLCGLCMLRINGKNRLSCRTLVEDNMTIEPPGGHPLIKDLVVDFSSKPGAHVN